MTRSGSPDIPDRLRENRERQDYSSGDPLSATDGNGDTMEERLVPVIFPDRPALSRSAHSVGCLLTKYQRSNSSETFAYTVIGAAAGVALLMAALVNRPSDVGIESLADDWDCSQPAVVSAPVLTNSMENPANRLPRSQALPPSVEGQREIKAKAQTHS